MKSNFILLGLFFLFSEMYGSIKIDSIQKTDSRCLNSGSIKVFAKSSHQIFYSIESGPKTVTPQVSNVLNSLEAGTYKVVVQNLLNERDSINVVINSSYITPDFEQIVLNPLCPNAPTGIVIGNIIKGKGLAPYQWKLTNQKTNQVFQQFNDTFRSLPVGDYKLTVTDSCLNTTVHFFELVTKLDKLSTSNYELYRTSCQDVYSKIILNSVDRFPLHITYSYKDKIDHQTVTSMPSNKEVIKKLSFDPKDTMMGVVIKSDCGDSLSYRIKREDDLGYTLCYSYLSCSSVSLRLGIGRLPSSVVITTKHGVFQNNFEANVIREMTIQGKIGDTVTATIIQCQDTLKEKIILKRPVCSLSVKETSQFNECETSFGYQIVKSYPNCISYSTFNYDLIDIQSNIIVDSGRGISYLPSFQYFPQEKNYKLRLKNDCGEVICEVNLYWRKTQTITNQDKLIYTVEKLYDDVCLDRTINLRIRITGGNKGGTVFLKSVNGPGIRKNSKPDYEYQLDNTYNTIFESDGFKLTNLVPGRYVITIGNDQCQNSTFTVDVNSDEVSNNFNKITTVAACGDNNKILINLYSQHPQNATRQLKKVNGNISVFDVDNQKYIDGFNLKSFNYGASQNFDWKDSVRYLKSGNYRIDVIYDGLAQCNRITKDIFIKSYSRPDIKVVVKIRCNEKSYVMFYPDSNRGVFPFKYEINSGPITYPQQYSNYFNTTTIGDYQAKIWDVCGNANTLNFSMDTLKFNPIYESDVSCVSKNVLIKYQPSPFFTYKWLTPSGTTFVGDSLKIDSVRLSDIGMYHVTRYVDFIACRDSFKNTYLVNKHKFYHQIDTIYKGSSVYFAKASRTISGTYMDTTYINPCDSIARLDLVVIDTMIIDSHFLKIQRCSGDTVFYRDSIYTKTGNYTIRLRNKWGQKVFIALDIEIERYLFNRRKAEICNDESFEGHTISGIYRDTFRSSQMCDSIDELTLTVHPTYSHSLDTAICAGEIVKYSGKIYTKTGVYRHNYKTINNCDSIETLTLKVLDKPYKKMDSFYACRSYRFLGKLFYKDTNLLDTLYNYLGCDSQYRYTYLNIGSEPIRFFDSIDFCHSLVVNGKTYYNSFYYRDTLKYKKGLKCDSMYRLIKYTAYNFANLKVTVYPNTNVFYQGEQVRIRLSPASTYWWSNGNSSDMVEFIATKDTWFIIKGWNTPKCIDSFHLNFKVLEPGLLDIPNAFAPSGMPENRIFKPNFKGMVEINRFEIYNRLGEKIYGTNTKDNIGWDGTYKGEDAPSGVFSYLLEYKVNRHTFFKSGEVLLVR